MVLKGVHIVVAFGFLVASGHSAPGHSEHESTASEVKAMQSKLHERVVRAAEAEENRKATRVRATASDATMNAAHYVGKKDWAWNAATASSATPANGKKDTKEHASTSADVDAYQNRLHEAVVKAKEGKMATKTEAASTKWNVALHTAGAVDVAADVKSQDWAWSALQAKKGLKFATKQKLDVNQKVYIENQPVLGDGAGEGALNVCRAFAAQHVSDPSKPAVRVCGTGIKMTAYLRGECNAYYEHSREIGKCDTSKPPSTCDEYSPADDARFGHYQSYKIEPCA